MGAGQNEVVGDCSGHSVDIKYCLCVGEYYFGGVIDMREQKINKNNPIYTESNFKNIKGDYYICQQELYKKQVERVKDMAVIMQKAAEKEKPVISSVIDFLEDELFQLKRYEKLKNENAVKFHALEYYYYQNLDNELIPAGMMFSGYNYRADSRNSKE